MLLRWIRGGSEMGCCVAHDGGGSLGWLDGNETDLEIGGGAVVLKGGGDRLASR